MSQALYDLPEGWEWERLGDVLDVRDGTHDSPKFVETGFPLVTSKNLTPNGLELTNVKYISKEDYDSINKRSNVDMGDILFAMIGTIGNPVLITDYPEFAIKNVALFKRKKLDQCMEYVRYYLMTPYTINSMTSLSKGATQKFVGLNFLRSFQIPFPPLAEQTRIVEKLDAVLSRIDTAIDELQQSIALVDAMFKSGLDKAFNPLGSPTNEVGLYDLPDGWGWHLVKDISQNIQYGHTAKATDSGNAGFLRITDIQDGMINWSGVPFVEVSEKELTKYELQKNDLVFARSGATAGKSILIDEPPKNMIFASYLIRIIPNQLIVFPKYLALFFQSPMYWSIVMQNASGAAQPNINGTKLGEFSVPLPNLAEQQRVVEALDALNDKTTQLKTELTAKIGMFNQLKASVLDGAFRGEL